MSRLKKIITTSRKLISKPQDSFGYVAFGMSILMLVTKISGMLELQILAHIYGIRSQALDIFNAANTIPEFLFLIVAIGGINAALIPVLTQASIDEGEKRLKEVLSSIVNIFFIALLTLCLLVFIFAPQIISLALRVKIANTSSPLGAAEMEQFVNVLRVLIFSPILLTVSSIFSSILQIKKRFFVTQLAPLFYNFGTIFAALFLLPLFNYNIIALAWGVLLGSLLHFLIQVPSIMRAGIEYSPMTLNLKDFYVLKALKQAIPRTVGLTSDYIGNIFQTILALRLATGSLTSFKYALSLRDIPVTMIGISISQALFPQMSSLGHKDIKGLQVLFSKGLRAILFWTLPVSALMIVLRTPLVRFVFGIVSRNITLADASLISYSLAFLSLGIVFYSILNLVNRAFYSLDDSKTPTIVSIIVIFIEIALTYGFVNVFSHFQTLSLDPRLFLSNINDYFTNDGSIAAIGGMGLASSVAIFINLVILIYLLNKKGINVFYEPDAIFKKLFATLLMLVIGVLSFKLLDVNYNEEKIFGILFLSMNVAILMVFTYYLSLKIMGDEDVKILDDPFKKLKKSLTAVKRLFRGNKIRGV